MNAPIKTTLLAAVTLTACLSIGCHSSQDNEAIAATKTSKESPRVTLATLEKSASVELLELPAELVATNSSRITLSPGIEARVVEWKITPGSSVEQGDTIAVVTSAALDSLRAEVTSTSASLKTRDTILNAREESVRRGFSSRESLQEARASRDETAARLAIARDTLAATRGKRWKSAGKNRWAWLSEHTGEVEALTCMVGEQLLPGARCVRLRSNDAGILARVDLPERYISSSKSLSKAQWQSASDDTSIELESSWREPFIKPTSRTQTLYFKAPFPSSALPGQAGAVTLELPTPPSTFAVSRFAVTEVGGRHSIFISTADGAFKAIEIERIGQRDDALIVASNELSEGMSYVARGAFFLKSKQTFGQ